MSPQQAVADFHAPAAAPAAAASSGPGDATTDAATLAPAEVSSPLPLPPPPPFPPPFAVAAAAARLSAAAPSNEASIAVPVQGGEEGGGGRGGGEEEGNAGSMEPCTARPEGSAVDATGVSLVAGPPAAPGSQGSGPDKPQAWEAEHVTQGRTRDGDARDDGHELGEADRMRSAVSAPTGAEAGAPGRKGGTTAAAAATGAPSILGPPPKRIH